METVPKKVSRVDPDRSCSVADDLFVGSAAEDRIGCALSLLNVKFSWPSAPTLRGFLTVITLAEWLILTSPRARGMDLRCVTLIFDHGY